MRSLVLLCANLAKSAIPADNASERERERCDCLALMAQQSLRQLSCFCSRLRLPLSGAAGVRRVCIQMANQTKSKSLASITSNKPSRYCNRCNHFACQVRAGRTEGERVHLDRLAAKALSVGWTVRRRKLRNYLQTTTTFDSASSGSNKLPSMLAGQSHPSGQKQSRKTSVRDR